MKTGLFLHFTLSCIAVSTLCAGASLQAGSHSSSADYRVFTQVIEASGGCSGSTDYSQEMSLGPIGGMASFASPAESVVKQGYVAQLYDEVALAIAVSPGEVSEDSMGQLSVWRQMDDASLLPLAATEVIWTTLSGPISTVTSAGQFTTGILFTDTPARVHASLDALEGTLEFGVMNVDADNFGSYAGDGLPDNWQVQHFGQDNPQAAPSLDVDGDGYLNLAEYLAGSLPNDPASFFTLKLLAPTSLEWPSLSGRFYEVQSSATLENGSWETLTTLSGTGFAIQWNDLREDLTGRHFYRVQVRF